MTKELETLRAARLSVWQFLLPMILTVFVIGLLFLNLIHPLTAASLARFENLQNLYFGDGQKTISIIDEGLWLRQADDTGNFIMTADRVDASIWELSDVSLYFFDNNNQHTRRIDAQTATLQPDHWIFENVTIVVPGDTNCTMNELRLATDLTTDTIAESFSKNPQTISFWRLPGIYQIIGTNRFGYNGNENLYQNLLVQPLFLISMVLLAAAASLRTSRFTKLCRAGCNRSWPWAYRLFLCRIFTGIGRGPRNSDIYGHMDSANNHHLLRRRNTHCFRRRLNINQLVEYN